MGDPNYLVPIRRVRRAEARQAFWSLVFGMLLLRMPLGENKAVWSKGLRITEPNQAVANNGHTKLL